MPDYTRGKLRNKPTYVLLFTTPVNIYYHWNAKDIPSLAGVSAADLTSHLGHLYTVAPEALVIVAASSPKPNTVRKSINRNPTANQQGAVSTFCGTANLNTASTNGWRLASRGRVSRLRNDARTITAIAEMSNELYYASPMNAADHAAYKQQLGLLEPNTVNSQSERNRVVTGASRPRAGRASKVLESGQTISAYHSHTAPIFENGWASISPEIV